MQGRQAGQEIQGVHGEQPTQGIQGRQAGQGMQGTQNGQGGQGGPEEPGDQPLPSWLVGGETANATMSSNGAWEAQGEAHPSEEYHHMVDAQAGPPPLPPPQPFEIPVIASSN